MGRRDGRVGPDARGSGRRGMAGLASERRRHPRGRLRRDHLDVVGDVGRVHARFCRTRRRGPVRRLHERRQENCDGLRGRVRAGLGAQEGRVRPLLRAASRRAAAGEGDRHDARRGRVPRVPSDGAGPGAGGRGGRLRRRLALQSQEDNRAARARRDVGRGRRGARCLGSRRGLRGESGPLGRDGRGRRRSENLGVPRGRASL
mmetsp:Transcript_3713/g.10988  ORF Transcript_3713/g.10988 Transcript_3713/m.10988 type:complete len:203 (+) Transcript_3713:777-1385(+)